MPSNGDVLMMLLLTALAGKQPESVPEIGFFSAHVDRETSVRCRAHLERHLQVNTRLRRESMERLLTCSPARGGSSPAGRCAARLPLPSPADVVKTPRGPSGFAVTRHSPTNPRP